VLLALAWLIVVLNTTGTFDFLRSSYDVKVLVPNAASLSPGSSVRIGGVKVGRVVNVTRYGDGALVGMRITDTSVTPIPVDSRVAVRLRTLVGENYIQIEPGTSKRRLRSGAILGMRQVDDYVEADQILSTLQGPTRQRLRDLIAGLAHGVGGRGPELGRLLGGASQVLIKGTTLFDQLASDRQSVALLVDRLGGLMRTIGDGGDAVNALALEARHTFDAVAQRDAALDQTLAALPGTVRQVGDTMTTLRSASAHAAPVLSNLALAVREVSPAARLLRPGAQSGLGVVQALDEAANPLRKALAAGRAVAPSLNQALPAVHKLICQVNPVLRFVTPFSPELISTITGLASAVNYYDATGHAARIYALLGANSPVVFTPAMAQAVSVLTTAGLLHQLTQLGYNPFPAQGTVGQPPTVGLDASGPATAQNPYPHILADC
jgi:phospholipid/cholesterol/gamma-HCH transport system substrate-binding protein